MKVMTPKELAAQWGITEKKVLEKIYNTLKVKAGLKDKDNNHLPKGFKVRRINSGNYVISVPDGYKFKRLSS